MRFRRCFCLFSNIHFLVQQLYIHAAVWQRFNHPNVAHFYGLAFDCGDMPAIIIEDYPHGNVIQYLTANPQVSQGHKLQLVFIRLFESLYLV